MRMALGAAGREIIGMVLKQGMILASVGLTIGIMASVALSRFVARLLFGIAATDPAVFGTVSLILVAIAFFACYLPARRATRIDPLVALRME